MVRDLDGNGEIDDGTELFGNNSVLSNGQKAANGFEALKDLDSNHDGKFSNLDTAWNSVKVWKDVNGNGLVEEGELLTLEQANVSEINLNYNSQETVDANGNAHAQNSTITKTDGTSGNISDIWFDVDLANTADRTEVEIPEAIKGLPNVEGFGNVHSLQVAMALDASGELKTLVEQFIAETNVVARKAILVNLIYHWTGVQDMDPEGRNPTQIYGNVLGDSRKLEALEEFIGKEYLGTWCWGERDPNPHGHAAPYILDAFEKLCDYVGLEILSQSQYQPLLENVALTWNAETQNWDIDVSAAVTILQNAYDLDAENGLWIIKDFSKILQGYSGELSEQLLSAFEQVGSAMSNDFEVIMSEIRILDSLGTNANDTMNGTAENDNLNGNAGNDVIYGKDGNDTLIGGTGNDYLEGGRGSDTYVLNVGFGFDSINNSSEDTIGEASDIVSFGEDILPENVSVLRDGYDLVLTVKYNDATQADDVLRIFSYFDKDGASNATVNQIKFADGTSWNYATIQQKWFEIISATGGGNVVEGTDENDDIYATSKSEILYGYDGNDILNAHAGNNILIGGRGNDTLLARDGNDTYVWNLGDGFDTISDTKGNDKVLFGPGIAFEDLTFRRINNDLMIFVNGDKTQGVLCKSFWGSTYGYAKIERIAFANGTYKDLNLDALTFVQTDAAEDYLGGNSGDNIIYAMGGNDRIYGKDGDETFIGGRGDDLIEGGEGDDTYVWNLGDGFDTISDTKGNDKVLFGPGIAFEDLTFRRINNDLMIFVNGDESQGVLCKSFWGSTYGYAKIERIAFANGTYKDLNLDALTFVQTDAAEDYLGGNSGDNIIYAMGGNDRIYGKDGDETFIGGRGDDLIEGGEGDDTYVWNLGDGFDTIRETSGNDKVLFGPGITFENLTFRQVNNDLMIFVNGDESQGMKISSFFYTSQYKIEAIEFADGSTFDLTKGLTLTQTDANEYINGTYDNDTIYGMGGNDTIYGKDGNDILLGGVGDDYLDGNVGNDTYVWNLGDGFDTINDNGGNDKIKFGEGIAFEDLTFRQVGAYGNDLMVFVKGNETQGMKISNFFYTSQYKIEAIEFADGSTMDISNADQLIQAMSSFGVNNASSMDANADPTQNVGEIYSLAAHSDLIQKAS